MRLVSRNARLEGAKTNEGQYAFMDTVDTVAGYGVGVEFSPLWAFFVLAVRDGRMAVIGLPNEKWKNDLLDDGWTIKQVLSHQESKDV